MFKVSTSSVVGGGPAYNLGGAVPLDHAAALVATFRSGGGCGIQFVVKSGFLLCLCPEIPDQGFCVYDTMFACHACIEA